MNTVRLPPILSTAHHCGFAALYVPQRVAAGGVLFCLPQGLPTGWHLQLLDAPAQILLLMARLRAVCLPLDSGLSQLKAQVHLLVAQEIMVSFGYDFVDKKSHLKGPLLRARE